MTDMTLEELKAEMESAKDNAYHVTETGLHRDAAIEWDAYLGVRDAYHAYCNYIDAWNTYKAARARMKSK